MATCTVITTQNISKDMKMCIYKITNKLSGKSYIGQSRGKVGSRWGKHIRGENRTYNSAIHAAISKHGVKNFEFLVIDFCETIEQLDYKEQLYIKQLGTLAPNGYNITTGGGKGFNYTDEHRAKLSASAKSKDQSIHKKHSEYMKQRMNTPEMKAFMADVAKRTHTGRKHTKEHIENRAAKRRGQVATDEQRIKLARVHMNGKVICCSNGEEYLSAY